MEDFSAKRRNRPSLNAKPILQREIDTKLGLDVSSVLRLQRPHRRQRQVAVTPE